MEPEEALWEPLIYTQLTREALRKAVTYSGGTVRPSCGS